MTQAGLRPNSNYVSLSYHKTKSSTRDVKKRFLHNMAGRGRGAMDALRAVAGIPCVRLPAPPPPHVFPRAYGTITAHGRRDSADRDGYGWDAAGW